MITSRSHKPWPTADPTTVLSAKPSIIACSLLAVTCAYGADELSCETAIGRPLAVDSPLRQIVLDNPETIQLALEAASAGTRLDIVEGSHLGEDVGRRLEEAFDPRGRDRAARSS